MKLLMSYTELFYWLVVADNAKKMFITFIAIFMIIAVFATICYLICSHTENIGNQTEEDKASQKIARKWMFWSYPFAVLFWSLYLFTPSKKDALLIVAGGQTLNFLTTDSAAKEIPHELSSFVITELKSLAQDAKVDLGITNQKERLIDEAKKMTTDELLDRLKTDTTLRNVLFK